MTAFAEAAIANKAVMIVLIIMFWMIVGLVAWRFIHGHREDEAAKSKYRD